LTYKEVFEKHPDITKQRTMEKINFRYPSGESYIDAIGRLEPLIYWIERQKHSVLVIGHQAIIRCISGYFFNVDLKSLPYIPVPLHLLIKLTPDNYTFTEEYVSVCL
jgi:6-phosphofructo-2-kinase / fructose-2,6-biphosphatase 2